MKKSFILLPIAAALIYLSLSSHKYGIAFAGMGDYTGASGTSPGCNCHAPSATSTTAVTLQLKTLGGTVVTSYTPGTTYNLVVSVVNNGSTTLPNFGFQATIVKLSGAGGPTASSPGTFGTPPSSTSVQTSGSLKLFEHYNSAFGDGSLPAATGTGGFGSTYTTQIQWTAPIAGTGSVVLYGIANLVDHDGYATAADLWNLASTVTICESPAAITGTLTVCAGATTTLSDATTGGTWSSGSTGIASVGSTTGVVTGVASGTATITYTTSCGTSTATVTVNSVSPGNTVSGGGVVCTGSTITISNINPTGSFTSASTGIATVSSTGPGGGLITGVSAGTAVISYTVPSTGCAATTTVTVNTTPTITGTLTVCAASTTALTGTPGGGTWTSGSTGIATVGSTGIVTGVTAGTANITYALASGCSKVVTVTVNTTPAAIAGTLLVCTGATSSLSNATGGGTWSSGTTGVATIGSTGTVAGIGTGTSVISYTLSTGCASSATVTVIASPSISGSLTVCPPASTTGATTTLTGTPGGGTWVSGSTGIATVGSGSGLVTGVSPGTSVITYTGTNTCTATATVTVNTLPVVAAITGPSSVCTGAFVTLADATTGGTWSSGSPATGSIDASGNVTGVSAGTTNITYAVASGSCTAIQTRTETVNASPAVAAISPSAAAVCEASTTSLTDATAGGTWSSSSPATGSVNSTGTVTGIAAGLCTISYSVTALGCTGFSTATVTVNPLPVLSAITGTTHVCVSSTTTLSNSASGGTWSSSATSIATINSTSGLVTGVSAGTATITYTVTTAAGCTSFVTTPVTVNALPVLSVISGSSTVCIGSSITLTDTASGGTWTSSNPTAGTIGASSGILTGVGSTGGTTTITYTLTNGSGCTSSVTKLVTVNPLPNTITGTMNVCVGSIRTLSDGTPGGTWTSSATGTATVGSSSGSVTGVAAGTATISYTLGTGCFRTTSFTVNPLPNTISGTLNVCVGATTALSDGTPGGTWSSTTPAIGSVNSSGIVTGVATGTTTISYTLSGTGCAASSIVTVNPQPAAISGSSVVCTGASINLTDVTPGGTWSSSATGTATVAGSGTTGTVTGVAAGTVTISYTLIAGCTSTKTITVNQTPSAITGTTNVCVGSTTALGDAFPGGTWTSSSTSLASVGSSSGVVSGIATGTPAITYTLSGCFTTTTVTVNPISGISGLSSACAGATTPLTDATPGGTWTSGTTSVATIGSSSGMLTAVSTGTSVITYTLPTGCTATRTFTVISAPSAISGSNQVCVGGTTALADAGGGTWSSSNVSIATVGSSSGIVSGVTAGLVTITYSLGTGCNATLPMTVNPATASITGTASVCVGNTTTLSDATPGGTWSTASANATVGSTGIVTGVSAGTAIISYISAAGCVAMRTVTVNALPATITGTLNVCVGSASTLTDGTPGGTWSSSTPAVGTVGSTTGAVTGISSGATVITYTLTSTGCATTATVNVNPLPSTITGTFNVCVGLTTTLSDGIGGGTWSGAPSSIATVGTSSGVVTGVAAGSATITYTLGTGCYRTALVTVNALPTIAAITGSSNVCAGYTTVLADATTGGTWSSSSPSIATIGSTGVVTGVAVGAATITYTFTSTAGCTSFVTHSITVNPAPSSITGTMVVCAGDVTTLSDATSGGTWSSGSTSVATVGSTGIVTGVSAGTATISYTAAGTGCFVTAPVTVNPLPASIGGTTHVCLTFTTTLTDASGGGTWSSSATGTAAIGTSSGVVTGIAVGTATITYTLPTGCRVTTPFTVNPLPNAGVITGPGTVCVAASITLSDTAAGGTWSSSSSALGTVTASGGVTGIAVGIDTIRYTVTNSCGSDVATKVITVNPLPDAGTITGSSLVCMGTPGALSDASAGGTWLSGNTGIATIGASTGLVTGVTPGTDTILYTVANSCGNDTASFTITVNALATAGSITGVDSVCVGDSIALGDLVTGGVWSASNGNATVSITGVVTGITAGTDTIRYSVGNICDTATATLLVRVRSHAECNVAVSPAPLAEGFSVFPNPANGSFTVQLPSSATDATIRVSDMLGKIIETRPVHGANIQQFSLHVAAGSYLVIVDTGDKIFRAKVTIW